MPEQSERYTKAEFLAHVQTSYDALEQILQSHSEAELSQPGAEDWAVKDHLLHLAAWEAGIMGLLQGTGLLEGMGLTQAEVAGKSEDVENDLLYRRTVGLSTAEAIARFHDVHRQMLAVFEGLTDEDLNKPYRAFLSPGEDGSDAPVGGWVVGNTYGHVDEHLPWIQTILADQHAASPGKGSS